jgi:uncharacterized membrane protein
MNIQVQVSIKASKEEVWKVITDIENAQNTITGIEKVEVLEKPADGLVGLKWKETRTLFGKTAIETMWITIAKENEFYRTRAESHGSLYISNLVLSEQDHGTQLTMEFEGIPQTFGAKLMSATMGFLFKNATKKALMQDLVDIKTAIEKNI